MTITKTPIRFLKMAYNLSKTPTKPKTKTYSRQMTDEEVREVNKHLEQSKINIRL